MEFDQVVKYAYGDDIRDVDWNVTARLGDLFRKVFIEERDVAFYVIVNDDPALQFGSGGASKRDVLLEITGFLMMLAAVNRERVALRRVAPDGIKVVPPTRRRAAVMAAIADLFAAPAPDPTAPFAATPADVGALPRGAVVVWLGEVPDVEPPRQWAALRRRHQVVGIRVEDAWEREGPTTPGMAYDPTSHAVVALDLSPPGRAAHAAWRARREALWSAWWPDPADRLVADAEGDTFAALLRFLKARRRAPSQPAFRAP